MGYDIHCYLEIKTINNVWHAFGRARTRINQNYTAVPVYDALYLPRNNDVFAVLSNIQNHEARPCLFPTPRGLPRDLSNELRVTFDSVEEDMGKWNNCTWKVKDQQTSYVTYAELTEFADKHPDVHSEIQEFKNRIADEDAVKYGAQYNATPELTWNSLADERKRVIFYYDW